MTSEKIVQWITDLEALSTRRLLGHELINYMTPLAMQISMLERNLLKGEQDSALERISKVQRSIVKLEDFSKDQFENFEEGESPQFQLTPSSIKENLQSVADLQGFSGRDLNVVCQGLSEPTSIDERLFTLFIFYSLDVYRSQGIQSLEVFVEKDADLHIRLFSCVNSVNPEDRAVVRIKRFAKIINTTTLRYQVKEITDSPLTWMLTLQDA